LALVISAFITAQEQNLNAYTRTYYEY